MGAILRGTFPVGTWSLFIRIRYLRHHSCAAKFPKPRMWSEKRLLDSPLAVSLATMIRLSVRKNNSCPFRDQIGNSSRISARSNL